MVIVNSLCILLSEGKRLIMKALICTNFKKEKSLAVLPELINKLSDFSIVPIMPENAQSFFKNDNVTYMDSLAAMDECDVFITVGGDGTILKWGKKAAVLDKPLLGINTGRLGFMTALETDEFDKIIALKEQKYHISRRMLMNAEFICSDSRKRYIALNDIVLSKGSYSKLPEFNVAINGVTVSRIRADGIIFSTPTGSTAYALSAGGPIIEPTIECMEMTPLCAHTLLNRPMIFSGNDVITVSFKGYEGSDVSASVDGDSGIVFSEGDIIRITKSDTVLQLIDINGDSFYNSVNNKLIQPFK